jgi:hypothetical protein
VGAKCLAAHDDLPEPDTPMSTTRLRSGMRIRVLIV